VKAAGAACLAGLKPVCLQMMIIAMTTGIAEAAALSENFIYGPVAGKPFECADTKCRMCPIWHASRPDLIQNARSLSLVNVLVPSAKP
jgi:hypothetical protein